MFPYVAGQQRGAAGGQWGGGVAGGHQFQRAVGGFNQPAPARSKRADAGGSEGFFEFVDAAPLGGNGFGQGTGRLAAAVGRQAEPVEGVVPHLGGIVEYATGRFLHDFFERGVFKLGALNQVVQVGDVSLMMLAVVELQCFFGDVGSQGIQGIREFGQFVFHEVLQWGMRMRLTQSCVYRI